MLTKLLVLCGGDSFEHEVSLSSARGVVRNLSDRFHTEICYITKDKKLFFYTKEEFLNSLKKESSLCVITKESNRNLQLDGFRKYDIVLPILHGDGGEDGVIQGVLEFLSIPYVGSGVRTSAYCMDKEVTKLILAEHGIRVVPYVVVTNSEDKISLDYPQYIVKPVDKGSSVGTALATKREFKKVILEARKFSDRVLVEQYIKGRELECAVLARGDEVLTSGVGEIITEGLYTYDKKYVSSGVELKVPADLDLDIADKVKELSKKVFNVLGCRELLRVDFFLDINQQIYVNEANTMPGLTPISLYVKLWEQEGINFKELLDIMIDKALSRYV